MWGAGSVANAGGSGYLRGMKREESQYVDVLLPLAMPVALTYRVPERMVVREGVRVVVPLRKTSRYVGLVWGFRATPPGADSNGGAAAPLGVDGQVLHVHVGGGL